MGQAARRRVDMSNLQSSHSDTRHHSIRNQLWEISLGRMAWSQWHRPAVKTTIGQGQFDSKHCLEKSCCQDLQRTARTWKESELKRWNHFESDRRSGSTERRFASIKIKKLIKWWTYGMYILEDKENKQNSAISD